LTTESTPHEKIERYLLDSGVAGPYTDRLHRSYWNLLRLWADP